MKHFFKNAALVIGLCALFFPAVASAITQLPSGTITFLEATYIPDHITFTLNTGDGNCPAGKFLIWQNANVDNTKTVFSMLLAAKLAGSPVYAYYSASNASNCTISNIGLN